MAAEAAAQVEAACAAFLNARSPDERSAAERVLLDFRKWQQPLDCCRHLLLHSAVPYAKLQALFTVRECLGAQWAGLDAAARGELQMLLLRQQTLPDAEHFVKEAAAQTLAVSRRMWAMMLATETGWMKYGSPLFRIWPSCIRALYT